MKGSSAPDEQPELRSNIIKSWSFKGLLCSVPVSDVDIVLSFKQVMDACVHLSLPCFFSPLAGQIIFKAGQKLNRAPCFNA